jgi:hypothetical protein
MKFMFAGACDTLGKWLTQKHPSRKRAHHQTEPGLAQAMEAEWISEPSIDALISIGYWITLVRYSLSCA